jgi:hypothetical protein
MDPLTDDLEDELPDPTELAPVAPPKRGPGRPPNPKPPQATSAAAEALAGQDDRTIFDWLQEIGTGTRVRIKLFRTFPETWQGHFIRGNCAEYSEPFAETDVRDRFGGGKFQVKTWRVNPKGGWMYAGQRSIELAGDPKVTGELTYKDEVVAAPVAMPARDDTSLQKQAMETMHNISERAQARADRIEEQARRGGQLDVAALTAPFQQQITSLERSLTALGGDLRAANDRYLDLATRKEAPSGPTHSEKILDKMIDGESARIEALRTQFGSEKAMIERSHADGLARERGRFDDELKTKEKAHEREISTLERTHAMQVDSLKQAYEGRLDTQKARLADLERQLGETRTETVALRALKQKGPLEAMQEVVLMKDAMVGLGLANNKDDEEQGGIWERIFMGFMESPLAKAAAARIEQSPPVMPPPLVRRPGVRRPPPQAMRRPAGPAGPVSSQAGAAPGAAPNAPTPGAPALAAPPGAPAPKPRRMPKLDPVHVGIAVNFIETAIRNGTDPRDFMASARSLIPHEIVLFLKQFGVDAFLQSTPLQEGSPLHTQNGRNFIRKVAKLLIDGAGTSAAPPVPVEPVEVPPAVAAVDAALAAETVPEPDPS